MRVAPILFSNISNISGKNPAIVRHTQYEPVGLDTFSFSGKINTPGGRNSVLKLAENGVGCFCCGRAVIPSSEINRFDSLKFFKRNTHILLNTLQKYKKFMDPQDKKILATLQELHEKYPEKSLKKLLECESTNVQAKLIERQSYVFSEIYDYCVKNLPEEKCNELGEIFQASYNEMYGLQTKSTFSRKRFLGLMYKFTRGLEPKHETKILDIAKNLPTSKNSYEAFVVKYSRKTNREIFLKLIQKRQATIEHIKPRGDGGADNVLNYALECAECNWERGNNSMLTQIEKNPKMPENVQKQINKIISLIKRGETQLGEKYLEGIKEAFCRESGGVIDLDISALKKEISK